jgi:hypothetical protein
MGAPLPPVLDKLLTEDAARSYLTDLGLPIGRSTFHKRCLRPDRAPPVATTFNGRKLRDPVSLLEWAIKECDPAPARLIAALDQLKTRRRQSTNVA